MTANVSPDTAAARTASILNVLAGIWLIISPFVLAFTVLPAAMWDSIAVGIVVLLLSWGRATNPDRAVGLSWINLVLGLWLIISPFVLGYALYPRPLWNHVVLGIVVAILALWSALTTPALPQVVRR
jgi:membrane protein YdbS with pleckstrin-like domain